MWHTGVNINVNVFRIKMIQVWFSFFFFFEKSVVSVQRRAKSVWQDDALLRGNINTVINGIMKHQTFIYLFIF